MFTPEYGDTVPSLLMGAAGMTYEKGSDENYGKQVYDHYLAIDTTINLTSNDKVNLTRSVGRAVGGGQTAGRATASCRTTSSSRRCTRASRSRSSPEGESLRLLLPA